VAPLLVVGAEDLLEIDGHFYCMVDKNGVTDLSVPPIFYHLRGWELDLSDDSYTDPMSFRLPSRTGCDTRKMDFEDEEDFLIAYNNFDVAFEERSVARRRMFDWLQLERKRDFAMHMNTLAEVAAEDMRQQRRAREREAREKRKRHAERRARGESSDASDSDSDREPDIDLDNPEAAIPSHYDRQTYVRFCKWRARRKISALGREMRRTIKLIKAHEAEWDASSDDDDGEAQLEVDDALAAETQAEAAQRQRVREHCMSVLPPAPLLESDASNGPHTEQESVSCSDGDTEAARPKGTSDAVARTEETPVRRGPPRGVRIPVRRDFYRGPSDPDADFEDFLRDLPARRDAELAAERAKMYCRITTRIIKAPEDVSILPRFGAEPASSGAPGMFLCPVCFSDYHAQHDGALADCGHSTCVGCAADLLKFERTMRLDTGVKLYACFVCKRRVKELQVSQYDHYEFLLDVIDGEDDKDKAEKKKKAKESLLITQNVTKAYEKTSGRKIDEAPQEIRDLLCMSRF
jgi:hypothetical protein